MTKIYRIFPAFIIFLSIYGCSGDNGTPAAEDSVYRIDVVAPADVLKNWQSTWEWFSANLDQAQEGADRHIHLDLNFVDEATAEDSYYETAANDAGLAAMIGPYSSEEAYKAAQSFIRTKKTLILPTATSVELQRLYLGRGFLWCLSECDMTQLEILLTTAISNGAEQVALLASDDMYGDSFRDWFGFEATELGLGVAGILDFPAGQESYDTLIKEIASLYENVGVSSNMALICACSSSDDIRTFHEGINRMTSESEISIFPRILHSDTGVSKEIIECGYTYTAVQPTADPESGFSTYFQKKFGRTMTTEAHFYDALLMLTYSLALMDEFGLTDLNDAIRQLVSSDSDTPAGSWMPQSMKRTLENIYMHIIPPTRGATGDWNFDKEDYTVINKSIYRLSSVRQKEIYTLAYVSSSGGRRSESSLLSWEWEIKHYQEFAQSDKWYEPLPETDERHAVVIAGTTGWSNYRHQADALAVYQLLKSNGYDDDHIILILADDIAFNERNAFPGDVHVTPGGENVYEGAVIDYRLDMLSPELFLDILTGEKSEALPVVLESDYDDNVFIYWCGHGLYKYLSWAEEARALSADDLKAALQTMSGKRMFRRLFFPIEACYSGSIGNVCKDVPNTLYITAANSAEESHADVQDMALGGVWLSNGFTRGFREAISENNAISFRDLYYNLVKATKYSHVCLYGEETYGSVYLNGMDEFL